MEELSPERWREVLAVLDEALERPAEERDAFLEAACAQDTALRREVEALLNASDDCATFFEGGARALIGMYEGERAEAPMLFEAGDRVGAYRIVRELGRGGMGVVYLAERADGAFEKQVALKVIKRGMDTDAVTRRFQQERRVLAGLEHPGIARLYDGGVTAGGLPYFVMERVRGQPLDEYCDAHQLSLRARLRLFIRVCEAVRYAHRNLVVHRDLKPSNILVQEEEDGTAEEATPLLLDFGIAKLLSTDAASGVSETMTRAGRRRLTPEYAAPEQVKAEAVTTATDVYALGVLLYELLAGRRPYTFENRRLTAIEETICEHVPPRPSTAVVREGEGGAAPEAIGRQRGETPRTLRRALRGDLDAIVLKALKKEPEARYASAGELLDDLRRYLDGQPVEAHDDSVRYRTSKFVRRNKTTVAAAAMVLFALVAGAAAALWQAREAAHAARRAEATLAFFMNTFEAVDPAHVQAQGGMVSAEDLIQPSLLRLRALDEQPLVQAAVMEGLGQLSLSLGEFATADSLYREALAIRRRQQGRGHPDVAATLVRLGVALRQQRRYAEARDVLKRTLELQKEAFGSDDAQLIKPLVELGNLYNRWAKLDSAETIFRMVLSHRGDSTWTTQREWTSALNGMAGVLTYQDSLTKAITLLRRAVARRRTRLGFTHPKTAHATYALADALATHGAYVEATELHRRALEIYRAVYGNDDYRVARSLYSLARVMDVRQADAQALQFYRQSAEVYEASALPDDYLWIAYSLIGYAQGLLERGRAKKAERPLRRSVAIYKSNLSAQDLRLSRAQALLGKCLTRLGRYNEAEKVLLASYSSLNERTRSVPDPYWEEVLSGLVRLYEETGQPRRAGRYRRQLRTSSVRADSVHAER